MAKNLPPIVDGIAKVVQEHLINPLASIELGLDARQATSFWLDLLASRVKLVRSRYPLQATDARFRGYLISKAGQYITNCNLDDLQRILQAAFGGGTVIDNGNMSLTVTVPMDLLPYEVDYLLENGMLPKPAGVSLDLLYYGTTATRFGFNGNGKGFNQAAFGRTKFVG